MLGRMGQIPAFHSAVQVQSDKSACTITCQRDTADTISADEREHVNYIHAYARNVNSAHTPHVYGPPPPTHTHTPGEYSSSGVAPCIPCPSQTSSPPAPLLGPGISTCTPCPPGLTAPQGSASCVRMCPAGSSDPSGVDGPGCAPCKAGFFSLEAGSTACTRCWCVCVCCLRGRG